LVERPRRTIRAFRDWRDVLAIKPVDNESFYREVDEELRREQLTTTWKRYGRWIILGVVLLLAAIAGFIYWQQQRQERVASQGEMLSSAFDEIQAGKSKAVLPRLDQLAKEGTPGYRAAALLTKADIAVQEGNEAGAIAAYQTIAADGDVPAPYRELALLRRTALEYDKIPPAAVIDRLKPLAVAGNPWFGSAGEMVALAYLKQQKPQEAARIFAALAKEEGVPESIKSRSVQMAGALGVDAVQQPESTPGAAKEVTQ
jgi:hypothetical protein